MNAAKKSWNVLKFAKIAAISKGVGLFNADWGRRYLIDELSKMPGIPTKIGQLLATKYSVTDHKETYHALPVEWIKLKLSEQSPELAKMVDEIAEHGVKASIGQMHWARLKTGQEVAIKVRLPEVDQQILEQLNLMLDGLARIPLGQNHGIDVLAYRSFFHEFFSREINYEIEAEEQSAYAAAWKDHPEYVIPQVLKQYSTKEILVQSFEPSTWLEALTSQGQSQREDCASLIAKHFLKGTFDLGVLQSDFHPRNWGYRPDKRQLVLYDFGAVLRLDEALRQSIRLVFFGPEMDEAAVLDRFADLGFDREKLLPIGARLSDLVYLLRVPLMQPPGWKIKDWRLAEEMEALLGVDKWYFRTAGPPWFLLLMRGFLGAIKAIERLDAPVDFGKWAEGPKVQSRIKMAAQPAHALRVNISEHGHNIVSLEFPVAAIEQLDGLIPAEVLSKLTAHGINLSEIKRDALASQLKPQELFQTTIGNRIYRVWIG